MEQESVSINCPAVHKQTQKSQSIHNATKYLFVLSFYCEITELFCCLLTACVEASDFVE